MILPATRVLTLAAVVLMAGTAIASAAEWDIAGFAAAEARLFPHDPADPQQDASILSPSLLLQPELRLELDTGRDRLTLIPFLRYDADDSERSHFDLREAHWLHDQGVWDMLIGVGKVFWGVAEARHLIDIINQTDLVENPDAEEKLGQPMINLNAVSDFGAVALFILPGFRDRTFPARTARLRGSLPIAVDDPVFDTSGRREHVDFAARWSHAIDDWDIGLSVFRGIGREPRLVLATDSGGARVLVPHYDIIDQEAIDLQLTVGEWLWKLEAISRGGQGARFGALVAGFEYSFFNVGASGADIGVLAEYLYDGRGSGAPPTAFEDDIFLGLRLALNDVGGTAVLAGVVLDRDTSAKIFSVEARHRLSDRWMITVEGQALAGVPSTDVYFGLRDDDYLQIRLIRYF